MPMRESPNLVNQLTTPKCLYQTITQTLAQSLCGYRCVICTCSAPMCCHGVCVQGLHSTGPCFVTLVLACCTALPTILKWMARPNEPTISLSRSCSAVLSCSATWHDHLLLCEICLNSHASRSTSMSPNLLIFRQEVHEPLDLVEGLE